MAGFYVSKPVKFIFFPAKSSVNGSELQRSVKNVLEKSFFRSLKVTYWS
jgi:hypothetical protein